MLLTLLHPADTSPPPAPPYPPPPPAWPTRIKVESRARQGGLIATLDDSFARTWQEPLGDVGSGSAQIAASDPDRASVPYRALLRFYLDGNPVFQSLIEQKVTVAVAPGEEHDQVVTISGRGSRAIFEEAVVYPYGGLSWMPFADRRVFDFSSPELNEGLWGATAVAIKQQSSPFDPYGGAPTNWPDPTAYWIWGNGGPPPYPVGFCYFAKRMFLAQETNVRFFMSADDGFSLRVDGAIVMEAVEAAEQRDFVWAKTSTADLWLTAGVHKVAIRGENIARPSSPATNAAAVLFSCYQISANGQLLPPPAAPSGPILPIMNSDATWKCVPYPTSPPALPLGEIFHFLFDEAKSRGCFGGAVGSGAGAYVDLGFSQTLDTNGNAWVEQEFGFNCGENLLNVLAEMSETFADFRMRPDSLVLDGYNLLGSTPGVSLMPGTNIAELQYTGKI